MRKYENFRSQLDVLRRADSVDLTDEFVMSGVASKFSLELELAWKLLKETLAYEGVEAAASGSPRTILKAAFATYDFLDEDVWLEMLKARNDLSHIYDEDAERAVVDCVIQAYIPAFNRLEKGLNELYSETLFSNSERF